MDAVEDDAKEHSIKLTAKRRGLPKTALAERDENAEPVLKKVHKPGKAEPDPIRGFYHLIIISSNESDMAASSARFDFTVPDAPTEVVVEDI